MIDPRKQDCFRGFSLGLTVDYGFRSIGEGVSMLTQLQANARRKAGAESSTASRAVHLSRAFLGRLETTKEKTVLSNKLASSSLAAIAGAAMLTFAMSPASAFTLASPSLEQS